MEIFFSWSNIILTGALILFAALQWRAVNKQNRQNLYKLRMELYSEINGLIWEIIFNVLNIKENIGNNKESASNITLKSLQISHKLLEITLLFNKELADTVHCFIKSCTEHTSKIDKKTDGTKIDFINIFEHSDTIKDKFENFFNKNSL